MEALLVLGGILLIPAVVAGVLAARTRWPRLIIATIVGIPLPLAFLVVVSVGYFQAVARPPGQCGFSCELDRSLAPLMMLVALGGMAIAVVTAFVTAMIVRRRQAARRR